MAEIKVDITNNGIFGYECPICGNEEIELGQNFCQICGEPIEWKENYEQFKNLVEEQNERTDN